MKAKRGFRSSGTSFVARIRRIGVNPYVRLPKSVLAQLFTDSGRSAGPIPVRGTIDGKRFTQTLVRYAGVWRLYVNGEMRRAAMVDVGDEVRIVVGLNPNPPVVRMPVALRRALAGDPVARMKFSRLRPSRRKEVMRYIARLKSRTAVERNVVAVMKFLTGTRAKRKSFLG